MPAIDALVRQYRGALIAGTTEAVALAARRAVGALPNVVQSMGQAFDRDLLPRSEISDINQRIARNAQSAIVSGYRSRLPRGGGGGGELSGALGAALASSSMTEGTNDRVISFLNTNVLNRQAKHWYRINYGAAGPNLHTAGSHEARTYTININGRPWIALRDEGEPAATSWLPRNFFWAGNRLVATRGPARQSGAGARAAHYVDLGLEAVAAEFPLEYDQFFRKHIQVALNRVELGLKGIHVIADLRLESYGYSVNVR